MAITLANVLKLPEFNDCNIVTGEYDLDKKVYRVTVIECPEHMDSEEKYGMQGDFNLTGLYAYKDHPELLLELVEVLVTEGSVALCYIDSFVKKLPEEVIQYANANRFLIIQISHEVHYACIISSIMEMIIKNRSDTVMERKIKDLMNPMTPPWNIGDIVYGINKEFKEYTMALMIRQKHGNEMTPPNFWTIKLARPEFTISTYGEFLLIIFTFSKKPLAKIYSSSSVLISMILESQDIINIGISSIRESLGEIGLSISESQQALDASILMNKRKVNYNEMGIYRLLILIRKDRAAVEFADYVVQKLINSDKKYKSQLMLTAQNYIECQCDVKKTAQIMDLHENSIRYRIERMKELFEAQDSIYEFNEIISIGLKLNNILKK